MAAPNPYLHPERYRVTAPTIVAQFVNGGESYVRRGAVLPTGTKPSQVEHLVSAGLVERIEVAS